VRRLEEQLYQTLRTLQWADPLISFFMGRKVERLHFDRIVYATKQLQQRQVSVSALADEVNQHIDLIGMPVTNQQVSLDFYTNMLGFEVRTNMEHFESDDPDVRWI
jgi:hypothetical protein